MSNYRPRRQGIELKKKHGQHFLKNDTYIIPMLQAVKLDDTISVMEVGCGEGILTGNILMGPCKQLKVFEIDPEWAEYVREAYGTDSRLHIVENNVLDVDWSCLESEQPWVLLANLPYQITFPFLYLLQKHRSFFLEGVVMIQEEVAQKIVQTSGRGYGYHSLRLQRYFEFKLLNLVPPDAFYPAPSVDSRLLYFKPILTVEPIEQEEEFWKFIKVCFQQPRRMLRNNLLQSHFPIDKLDETILKKRGQELGMKDFLDIWSILIK